MKQIKQWFDGIDMVSISFAEMMIFISLGGGIALGGISATTYDSSVFNWALGLLICGMVSVWAVILLISVNSFLKYRIIGMVSQLINASILGYLFIQYPW